MARMKNDAGVDAVRKARHAEKISIQEAKVRAKVFIQQQIADAHNAVLEAIRQAYLAGASKRQIAMAYGTSDPHTIARLLEEATAGLNKATDIDGNEQSWEIIKVDGEYSMKVFGFGEDLRDGQVSFTIDDDGVNITATEGDLWIIPTAYRIGVVANMVEIAKGL